MLKRLQDCYQPFADYFFPSVKTESSQTDDTPPLTNIQAYSADLGNAELPTKQRAKAAESVGLLPYTGTMSNAA